jgi:hypothetical protein
MNEEHMETSLQPLRLAALVIALLSAAAPGIAQTNIEPEEFSAFAVNMGALTGGGTAQLIITVNRWSTQAERDGLFATLKEKGQQGLLDAISNAKRVGNLRTPNSIGYELRLALMEPGKDGGRRVLLFTDRPVGFYEATNRPPSVDYPFTVIDIQMPAEGPGKGTMSIAAKIIPAGRTILVENYDTQPVQLNRVESRKLKR